jgi:hypothetical protein
MKEVRKCLGCKIKMFKDPTRGGADKKYCKKECYVATLRQNQKKEGETAMQDNKDIKPDEIVDVKENVKQKDSVKEITSGEVTLKILAMMVSVALFALTCYLVYINMRKYFFC